MDIGVLLTDRQINESEETKIDIYLRAMTVLGTHTHTKNMVQLACYNQTIIFLFVLRT